MQLLEATYVVEVKLGKIVLLHYDYEQRNCIRTDAISHELLLQQNMNQIEWTIADCRLCINRAHDSTLCTTVNDEMQEIMYIIYNY